MGMNDASAAEALVKYGAEKAEDIFILDEADVNKLMEKPYGLKPLPAKKLLKRLKEASPPLSSTEGPVGQTQT
eukprot:1837099-Rhodomonas_salina.1